MDFGYSEKTEEIRARVAAFMAEHIYPSEEKLFAQIATGDRWQPMPLMEELKDEAKGSDRPPLRRWCRSIAPAPTGRSLPSKGSIRTLIDVDAGPPRSVDGPNSAAIG